MKISNVNDKMASNMLCANTRTQDVREKNLLKQIADTQDKLKKVSEDKELSLEQKMDKKKELQEQIQSLNSELRQYQVQKRREEAAKRQEALKQEESRSSGAKGESAKTGLSSKEMGVIVSISSSKEQIDGLKKVKTTLEGRLRTASSEEEKADLQEKINNVTQGLADRVKETDGAISENRKEEKEETENTKEKKDGAKEDEMAGETEKTEQN